MERYAKRLIVCCDGTWNSPDQHHVTNVVRTARAVRPLDEAGIRQVVFYDWGIGSYHDKLSGGLLGAGIDRNIQDAYRFLAHNYVDGDQIYLFGFSRGAYTARSLAGFIRHVGLLGKIGTHLIPKAYRLYRGRAGRDALSVVGFRRAHSRDVRINFIGVWDTVGALGVPSGIVEQIVEGIVELTGRKRRYAFHDTTLSPIIDHACHAVAIDERRIDFEPTLWRQLPGPGQLIEQQWFAGVHGDVGGGNANTGLSDLALDWMWSRAETHGLSFDPDYRRSFVKPNPLGKLHRSWKGIYRVRGVLSRPIGKLGPALEGIHPSVHERYQALAGYRPANLTAYLRNL